MRSENECSSYRLKSRVCADGFVQVPFCSGFYGCPTCGRSGPSSTPPCLRDEIPAHLADAKGGPLFYRPDPEDSPMEEQAR
jgi:hypothetical protein